MVHRWHIRKNNVDEPIDGYDSNHDFKAAHRTHQSIALSSSSSSSSQQTHQPYQMKHNNNNNNNNNRNNNNGNQLKRIYVLPSGTLSLNDIRRTDAGVYQCIATNTEGSETLEIQLSVMEALTVQILPTQQTVDLGKSTDLVCNIVSEIENLSIVLKQKLAEKTVLNSKVNYYYFSEWAHSQRHHQ